MTIHQMRAAAVLRCGRHSSDSVTDTCVFCFVQLSEVYVGALPVEVASSSAAAAGDAPELQLLQVSDTEFTQ